MVAVLLSLYTFIKLDSNPCHADAIDRILKEGQKAYWAISSTPPYLKLWWALGAAFLMKYPRYSHTEHCPTINLIRQHFGITLAFSNGFCYCVKQLARKQKISKPRVCALVWPLCPFDVRYCPVFMVSCCP